MAATALPASMTLPPPTATTSSQAASRAAATAASIISTWGSVSTLNTTDATPLAFRRVRSGSQRAVSRPVTKSARRPNLTAASPSRAASPHPNRIRPAVWNSKRFMVASCRVCQAGGRQEEKTPGALQVFTYILRKGRANAPVCRRRARPGTCRRPPPVDNANRGRCGL